MEREHNSQNRPEQTDVGRIAADRRNDRQTFRDLKLKAFPVAGISRRIDSPEEEKPLNEESERDRRQENEKTDDAVVDSIFEPIHPSTLL